MPLTILSRPLLAGALLAAALAPTASAQAAPSAERCEQRLERLEARFYEVAERRGYEAATEWWDKRWAAYHDLCVV